MRSRWIIGACLLAVLATGCAYFPGGGSPTAPRRAVPSAGCAAATPRTPGQETMTLTSGGVERQYIRRIPTGYDGTTPIPVLFAIHGLAEGAVIHTAMSEWGPRADAGKFVVLYPQGLGSPARWDTAIGSPDLAFIKNLLDRAEADLCLDQRRVFAAGLSMGGFMSSAIACQFADRFAAVAPVAGMITPPGCAPTRKVPVVTFHGTLDTWVPYSLIPPNIAAWAKRNGCVPTPRTTRVTEDVVLDSYLCPLGAEVGLYRVEGGGHAWPGSEFSRAIVSAVGFTTFTIHASDIIWDFFLRHPMPEKLVHRR